MNTFILILTIQYGSTYGHSSMTSIDGFSTREMCDIAGITWQKNIRQLDVVDYVYVCVAK